MTKVSAPLTGTVWKLEVAVGDLVEEGQTVVVLESMKMEMPIEAPCAGKVTDIAVTQGQQVDDGDVLLSLD